MHWPNNLNQIWCYWLEEFKHGTSTSRRLWRYLYYLFFLNQPDMSSARLAHHVTYIHIDTWKPPHPHPITLYQQVTMETGSVSTSSTVALHFLIVSGSLHPSVPLPTSSIGILPLPHSPHTLTHTHVCRIFYSPDTDENQRTWTISQDNMTYVCTWEATHN